MPRATERPPGRPGARGTIAAAVAAAIAASPLAAQPVPDARVVGGTVGFDANSTVGAFGGQSSEVTGEVTGGPSPAAVRGWVALPARSLRTGISQRDRHMWGSLEADRHPRIVLEVADVTVQEARADTVVALVRGTLTVRGVTRPVASTVTAVPTADGFDLSGRFPIDLREWEVGGLRRMLGMLRVDPEITVWLDLSFGRR